MNSKEAIRQGVANLGLRDIWKLLEWLHVTFEARRTFPSSFPGENRCVLIFDAENIEGFGGDPERITVFGQSSGGLAAEMLAMAYSGNHHMFSNGITSSITLFSPFWGTIAACQSPNADLLNITGCTYENENTECLGGCEFDPPPPKPYPTSWHDGSGL